MPPHPAPLPSRRRLRDCELVKPDDVADLDRQLQQTIDAQHDCDCEVCQQRQRDAQAGAVRRWCFLSADEQVLWLERHDELDELGQAMRALLAQAVDEGVDVVAKQADLDARRWPEHR